MLVFLNFSESIICHLCFESILCHLCYCWAGCGHKLKMKHNVCFAVFIVLLVGFAVVLSLECYVCKNQEDNDEKCVKTIKTCDYGQDVCLTEIKWGSTPYWSQGAKKQYYVTKQCSNKTECATTRHRYMPYCTHIWYQDWVCSDCCQGDRCNYYIINGSSHLHTSNFAVAALALFVFYISTMIK